MISYIALVAGLCPRIGHAQLLPNQALTVDITTDVLHVIDDTEAILSSVPSGFFAVDVVVTPDGTTGLVSLFNPTNELRRFDLTTSPPTLSRKLHPVAPGRTAHLTRCGVLLS